MTSAVGKSGLSKVEKDGLIQRFEYTFEPSWETLRDYLRYSGVETDLPRDVIKAAFAAGLIQDGKVWIEMLEKRNLISHTYDEAAFEEIFSSVTGKYRTAIAQVYRDLKAKASS